ncbi:GNAT family N-acetyltransferase [Uliginosibacterium sp. 31-16]|uniref:GNAT family N-acetyltransferase n=1 Tax=Uliginosibacterium sp. 31-16 TaxID=3068315 RepID=UPI00273F933C|nr:GNAT family N-acetyltransferase [Uliginosibacterium sp. 31-16]MDP5238925.1 GNAT family N-acetyltransferase [Uliginosibacterium sp. 31-16]
MDSRYQIFEATPSAEEFNHLRELAGWGKIDPAVVNVGLCNSVHALCAWEDDELVGFVRLVGDGAMKLSVEELLVHPEHRRRGIATALMAGVMAYIAVLPPGCTINLMAAEGLSDFYTKLGFRVRPETRPGMQMRR